MSRTVDNTLRSTDDSAKRALILIVERNPAIQQLERFLMEQAGYAVELRVQPYVIIVRKAK